MILGIGNLRLHGRMRVRASMDRYGNVCVGPVAKYWRQRFQSAIDEISERGYCPGGLTVDQYIQNPYNPGSIMDDIPRRYHRDLEHGWPVVFLMDPWTFAHLVGYDCPELF